MTYPGSVRMLARARLAVALPVCLAAAMASSMGAGSAAAGTGRAGIISTIAGGVGGPGAAANVAVDACGVAFAGDSMYTAAGTTVRKVDPGTGRLTTPAGTGTTVTLGDGGSATRAGLYACGVARDAAGNLVIADRDHNRVRVVAARTGTFYGQAMTAGDIYTIAGDGAAGHLGDGGPATSAELNFLSGVTVDGAGNVLIADNANNRVRAVAASTGTFYGQAMTAGDIYTIAGTGAAGHLGDGGPAIKAELRFPANTAVDGAGNVLIADSGNDRVRAVAATSGTFYGQAMTAGDIYTIAGTGTEGFAGDGGPATSAELGFPNGLAMDKAGNLLIADTFNNRIRTVAATTGTFYGQAMTAGHIYTIAGSGLRTAGGFSGDGGPAVRARLSSPYGVAVNGSGNVAVADTFNSRIRMVTG